MRSVFVQTDDGAEIAKKLGTTRQNVSQTLKRAIKKYYLKLKEMEKDMGPFELALTMMNMFGVIDKTDVVKFYNLFPHDIRQEIKSDVINCREAGLPLYERMHSLM
jgi:DNA-binding transcriptional regulator LsrR (DeoR family)